MTNSLSSLALKVMNIILKPYEKNSYDQFSNLLPQVPSENEQFFLCLLSIMLGSPNCINHSLNFISNKLSENNNSDKVTKQKTTKDTTPDSDLQFTTNLFAPKNLIKSLTPKIITSFWTEFSSFYRSKKDPSSSHIHLASLIDLIPTFYDEEILDSLLAPKNSSFLVINYIQKLKDNNLSKLSDHIIEKCSTDQIKLFIPFIISNESSAQVIENWLTKHIYEQHENNFKYETALTSALSSYQCVQLLPTTIDLIMINFFNGKFSVNSEIFESFLFYIQRNIQLFDRNKFPTKEDFLMTFFSSFIKIRPNLFKGTIVCPDMFTKMVNNKIRIPPFSLSLFFGHLDDFLLKHIAKQFIVSRSYINYLKRCYEKSMKTSKNSYSRKVLDYSIMALFLKTTDVNSSQYPIVIEMTGKMKMPREEFANLVFMQIARMFSNQNQRIAALHIIENWKKDHLSMITKLLLVIFNTKNINALVNVEEIICKRGGHALTALFNLASTPEFCQNKARKTLLITIIQRLVSKINVSRLKPRNYMQTQLYELINSNMNSKNNETNLKSKTQNETENKNKLTSPSKSRLRSKNHSNKKDEDETEKKNIDNGLLSPKKQRTRTASTSNLKTMLKENSNTASPSKEKTKSKIRETESESDHTKKKTNNDKDDENSFCKLTNDQLEKFLVDQITNKNSNKIDISEIVNSIIKRINSLDRKHSKRRHSKSKSKNTNTHKHSKEKRENEINKNEEDENKKETPKEEKNENDTEIQQKEEEEEELNDDQIELNNSKNEANENSGFYNVVGSVMKMLFGFGSSQSNNNEENNNNNTKQNHRSSLPPPIPTSHIDETNKNKENEKKIPVPSLNNLTTAKTQPLFEEEIEISSEGVMAFPDEDYSSSSSDYSDIDISNFDFDISDNEIPTL